MNFDLSTESLVLYFNVAFGVLLFLRAFVGFVRGTRKSIFYLIATAIVYVGGWFLMNMAIDALLKLDLGFLTSMGIPSSFNVNGVTVKLTTGGEMINDLVVGLFFPGQDLTNTVTLSLVTGVATIALRFVYFIILIILSDTILKWIFDIIWLCVRPKKQDNGKGKMKRPKPKFLSRLGGFAIGAAKGAFLLLIIFFLIGGIASIVSDVNDVLEVNQQAEKYDLILLSDSFIVVEEDTKANPLGDLQDQLKDYKDYIDFIAGYRNTVAGKVYGTVKINGTAIDEYIFDEMFAINIDVEDGDYKFKDSVQFRKEIKTIVEAFNELLEKDPDALNKITSGDYANLDRDALAACVDKVSNLNVINVIMPVGIEFVFLSNVIQIDNSFVNSLLAKLDYKDLRIATAKDMDKVCGLLVDVAQLIDKDQDLSNINIFALNGDKVSEIFKKLGELGLVDSCAPAAIEVLLDQENIKKIIQDLGLNYDDVKAALVGIEDWGTELSKLGVIAKRALELGLSGTNFAEMDYSKLDVAKVEALVTAIFDSKVVKEILPIAVSYGLNKVSDNETFGKVIEQLNITKDTDWEAELTPLIKAALVLLKNGLISNETFNGGLVTALEKISEDDFKEIAKYLSESKLLTDALNEVIKTFLNGDKIELLKGIEIQVFTEEEIAAGKGWSKDEITAILLTAKDLLSSGILSTGADANLTDAFTKLSSETIENIATHLSQSTFFKRNLSGILKGVFNSLLSTGEGSTLEINVLTEEEWTKEELSSIFNSVVELVNIGLLNGDVVNSIKTLSDAKISNLAKNVSGSKFITGNFGNIIDYAISQANIGFEINGLKEMTWDKNEIATILKAARDVLGFIDGKEVTDILGCSDKTLINNLLNSRVLVTSIGSFVKTNSEVDESGNPKGSVDLTIIKGADKLTDDDWADTILSDTITFTVDGNKVLVANAATLLTTLAADRLDVYADGEWVGYIEEGEFSFDSIIGEDKIFTEMPATDKIVVKARKNGELRRIFNAFNVLFPDGNVNIESIDSSIILDLSDEDLDKLLSSVILTETIRSIVIDLDTRNEDGTGDTTIYVDAAKIDAKGWAVEIKAMVKAVKVVLGENPDLENANPDVNKILASNDEDLDKILASDIITDTLIKALYDQSNYDYLGNPRTGGTIYIPLNNEGQPYKLVDSFWRDQDATHPGEIRKMFKAIQALFTDSEGQMNIDFNNIEANQLLDLNDEKIDILLNSQILEYTIRKYIIELDTRNSDGTGNTTIYVDASKIDTVGWAKEIKAMVKAVKVVLGDNPDLNNANPDVNTILASNDADLDKILASVIITDTLIKALYDQSDYDFLGNPRTGGTINIPLNNEGQPYKLVDSFWRDEDSTHPGEVRKMFKAIQALFTDSEGHMNIDFNNIEANQLLDLNDAKIDTLLDSKVLECTIKKYVVELDTRNSDGTGDTTIYVDAAKIDTVGWATEIKAMVKAVKVLLGDNPDLNNANPDVNTILAANDADLDKLLGSVIITDTLIKALYDQSNYDYLGNAKTGGTILIPLNIEGQPYKLVDSFWRDQDSTHPGEVRKLFKSIQTLFTDSEGHMNIDFDNINADAIFDLTEAKIDTLLNSGIMNCTCADILDDVLYGASGALKGMIWEPETNRIKYVEDNQGDLFKVLINLKSLFGISYDGFDFDSFKNAISTDGDAYVMSEVLCGSTILSNSFKTMFGKLIGDNSALSGSVRTKVTSNINNIDNWANTPTFTDEKVFGELALLLRALTVLTSMDSASTVSAATMNDPLQKLNASKVLQPVVSEILDKALDSVGSWKKTGTLTLSSVEWSKEIELMVDLVNFAENSFTGGLGTVSNASALNSETLEDLIKYISKSRILDINNIDSIVETAVNAVWSNAYVKGTEVAPAYSLGIEGTMVVSLENPVQGGTTPATLTISGYTNTAYDTFVTNWEAEAVAIRDAIAQLDKAGASYEMFTKYHDDVTDTDYFGAVYQLLMVSRFLDLCENTCTLKNTVVNVATRFSLDKTGYSTWEAAVLASI